jgi:hypothetical protein
MKDWMDFEIHKQIELVSDLAYLVKHLKRAIEAGRKLQAFP